MKSFSSYLPITKWARNYNKDWLRPDIIAGITVGAFLIPESIAYVSLANLPPEVGLYSAMVAVLVYVIFGTSRQLSVGPLSTLSILVGSTLGSLMIPNAAQYAMIASLVAVIAGLLAILSWALRLGFIVKFISKPVLTGFLAGIALFIASGQIAKLFGIYGGSGTFFQRIYYFLSHIDQTNLPTLAVGVAGILFLYLATKKFPKLPNTLFLVLGSTILITITNLTSLGVKVVGYIPQGLPSLVIPDPSLLDVNILITLAATVFLISYMEGYLFAAEYAAKNKYKIDKNQELLALGASNIAVGLFQGLPVAGALSRTAINNDSGAKTQLAGGVSGLVILLVLVFLTGIFTNLPETILAAIVLFIIKGLVDIPHLRNIYNFSKIEFIIAIITLLSVLFFGALEGIVIGVILSVVGLIKKMYNPHIAVLGKMPGKDQFLDIKRRPEAEIIPEILIVRVDGSQIFLNTEDIKNNILNLIDHEYKDTKLFILDFEATSFIDHSGTEMLEGLYDELQQRGIKLKAANMYGPLKDSLQKTKLEEEIVESTVSLTIEDCIEMWELETRN
ncbi:SulP family inorganic anion transporter [Methanobacterium sp.]|uniref:SulP family inorganic anion transporter n=1 Tax=Methanobacterium sp. TaxID=2164 RepID=UPI0025EF6BBF|nr:SulP family inorganic anion transporter [Methanobacterium sp.]MBI5458200.1 SulP family inorganic anion transporter [Methanobacterium sp.]MDY9922668.1 SulP family inorganic anion transporter [Methanobacterium sp.]